MITIPTMIAQITLFSPLAKLFDYKIPNSMLPQAVIGVRVKIPFGKKIIIGFIVDIINKSRIPKEKLKEIIEIIDPEPLLPKPLYLALHWAAAYYQTSIGAILACALPKYIKEHKLPKNNNLKSTTSINNDNPEIITLNQQQQTAINNILLDHNKFAVHLLDGVTGSGKTEVYLQLTKHILAKQQQVLILVPEIGLTPQTWQRFTNRFPNIPIAILHSHLSAKQRYINWNNAKNGIAKIILGTRSAAFVPLLNAGLFIIDEEHDLSFKQQEAIRYTARDFLIMRAKFTKCPIVLGSATPSLETIHNINLNKYTHYILPNRINTTLPPIELVDIRHKKLSSGLSNATICEIKQHLAKKNQVLLFINRRGFAPILKCFNCQFIKKCRNCDANMTLHIYSNKLHCHHCQETHLVPPACPNCQHTKLVPIGQGTERIEQVFQELFPDVKIARIDQDSTSKKQQFDKILTEILAHKIDLLIGTQMIAKGHHFPKLSLVVIIDSDQALFSNDFRATERLAQLILQVAGRAGRETVGKVLLQTCYPNNIIIQKIASHNYAELAALLLKERKVAELPPFSHQILWRVDSNTIENAIKFLINIKNLALTLNKSCKIFGPIPAIMAKRQKKFHARLLFQHTNRNILQTINQQILNLLATEKIPTTIKWSIDVDPKETF